MLKNALVIDLHSPYHNKKKDIFIENGYIKSFGKTSSKKVIDCSGRIVTPGWFDLNANFCDPGFEFKEDLVSGSKAASFGGFTDVNLMPMTNPPVLTKGDVKYIKSKAFPEVDLHVSGAVSQNLAGENLTEMMDLQHAGVESFSEGDKPISNAKLLLKALQYTSQLDVPIFQNARDAHLAENAQMHEGLVSTTLGLKGEPSLSEELIIARDLAILEYSGGSIHFSKISSAGSVDLIRKAKKKKLKVTCDVSVHHLLFTDSTLKQFDSTYKALPPFRSESDRIELLKGVREGAIDAICSDHRPQDAESKKLEFDLADAGAISLQTISSALLRVKEVPLEILIDKITNGPRRVLGIEMVNIIKGAIAKLTILDANREWKLEEKTNLSKSNNSPFWKENLTGKICGTVNGQTVSTFD
ncbi:MAG: dihydroorotase [Cyclobacteriaceae bacterium]